MVATVVPTHLAAAVPEVAVYLKESVGNSTRIDYGTGTCHAQHFLRFTVVFSWAASFLLSGCLWGTPEQAACGGPLGCNAAAYKALCCPCSPAWVHQGELMPHVCCLYAESGFLF